MVRALTFNHFSIEDEENILKKKLNLHVFKILKHLLQILLKLNKFQSASIKNSDFHSKNMLLALPANIRPEGKWLAVFNYTILQYCNMH
jgi:hypothetical protein